MDAGIVEAETWVEKEEANFLIHAETFNRGYRSANATDG